VVLLYAATVAPAVPRAAGPSGVASDQTPALSDWYTYLGGNTRNSNQAAQDWLATSNASTLAVNWSFAASAAVASQVIVNAGVAYFGSWDGNEYAVNVTTGHLLWKTFLGRDTVDVGCNGGTIGVSSAPTVTGGILYVGGNNATGGANATWYALNATTGAILWGVPLGLMANGYYNWASPLIYDGYAYVGIASECIHPLVQGELFQINLHAHVVKNSFRTTPFNTSTGTYDLGASIWASPSDDPTTNTVFVATGNVPNNMLNVQEPYGEAIIAFNATNISRNAAGTGPGPEAVWQVPQSQAHVDGDFGAGVTVLKGQGPGGEDLLIASNKNGYIYAWNGSNFASWSTANGKLGTLWQVNTSTTVTALVTPAASGGGLIYAGTPAVKWGTTAYNGSIFAVNPRTGHVQWKAGLAGDDYGAPLYSNGLLIVVGGKVLYVFNALTGVLYGSWTYPAAFFSAPSIAEGRLFEGNTNGEVYALCVPSSGCVTTPQP
jgi:outer membrane protein assembly factor BamB